MQLKPHSMIIEKGNNQSNSEERKILWIQPTLVDKALHKMADLEVLRQLAKRKYSIYIILTTSNEKLQFRTENSQVRTISIPHMHATISQFPFKIPNKNFSLG